MTELLSAVAFSPEKASCPVDLVLWLLDKEIWLWTPKPPWPLIQKISETTVLLGWLDKTGCLPHCSRLAPQSLAVGGPKKTVHFPVTLPLAGAQKGKKGATGAVCMSMSSLVSKCCRGLKFFFLQKLS